MSTAIATPPETETKAATITVTSGIRQVCDPAAMRYALAAVQFKPAGDGEGFLLATNGKVAAVVPCKGTESTEVLIPCDVLPRTDPKSTKWKSRSYRVERSGKRWFGEVYEGERGCAAGLRVAYEMEGRFPNIPNVIGSPGPVAVRIDARELAKLAAAISERGVITLFVDPEHPDAGCNAVGKHGIGKIMLVAGDDKADRTAFDEVRTRLSRKS